MKLKLMLVAGLLMMGSSLQAAEREYCDGFNAGFLRGAPVRSGMPAIPPSCVYEKNALPGEPTNDYDRGFTHGMRAASTR